MIVLLERLREGQLDYLEFPRTSHKTARSFARSSRPAAFRSPAYAGISLYLPVMMDDDQSVRRADKTESKRSDI